MNINSSNVGIHSAYLTAATTASSMSTIHVTCELCDENYVIVPESNTLDPCTVYACDKCKRALAIEKHTKMGNSTEKMSKWIERRDAILAAADL